jgi:hypothetical protein
MECDEVLKIRNLKLRLEEAKWILTYVIDRGVGYGEWLHRKDAFLLDFSKTKDEERERECCSSCGYRRVGGAK